MDTSPENERRRSGQPQSKFDGLPAELQKEIVSHLDDASVCRLYAAYNERWKRYTPIKKVIANRLKKITVCVTPVVGVGCDTTLIDFKTWALLPLWCTVHVKTPVAFWELAKSYILQLQYALLEVSIYYELELSCPNYVDLKGLNGNVVAVHLENIDHVDIDDIPKSTKQLSLDSCSLGEAVNLTHLAMLTHVDIQLDVISPELQVWLPELVTTLHARDRRILVMSPLPNLQHYFGYYDAKLPWSQLKTITVDYIPGGTRCDLLEEVVLSGEVVDFKTIYCPKLRSVEIVSGEGEEITDIFTDDQLSQLQTFKGKKMTLSDLTLLQQVKELHVKYDQILTEHTALSPTLIKLAIISEFLVDGVPDQLTAFEYTRSRQVRSPEVNIAVASATLKRLVIDGANRLSVDCPHLDYLKWYRVRTIVECKTPSVKEMYLDDFNFTHGNLPNLRRLEIDGYYQGRAPMDVVIDHHLESVTLKLAQFGAVSFSANKVTLKTCRFLQTPSITARVVDAEDYHSHEGITCQQLICDTATQLPSMVERACLQWMPSDSRRWFRGCDNLRLVIITHGVVIYRLLAIPPSAIQLHLPGKDLRIEDIDAFKKSQKLELLQWGKAVGSDLPVDPPPDDITNGLVQVGSTVWCRPDTLTLRRPSDV